MKTLAVLIFLLGIAGICLGSGLFFVFGPEETANVIVSGSILIGSSLIALAILKISDENGPKPE